MKTFLKPGRWLAAGLCVLIGCGPAALAQGGAGAGQEPNRFLLVVDTASAMRASSNGVEQAVFELFKSDMKGEFRPGDTIGCWTYNGELHADLPMQIWKEADRQRVAESIITVLREQGYHGRARLAKVMPAIKGVVAKSRRITVVLIYDGSETVAGTPFDGDINSLIKQFGPKLRGEHTPFVVALAAKDGGIFDYTVNTPGSISIPHTALPWPPPVTNTPPVVEAQPAPPPPAPAPAPHHYSQIVMSGHAVLTASNAPIPATPPPETNQIVVSAVTNTAVAAAPAPPPPVAETNMSLAPGTASAPPPPAQPIAPVGAVATPTPLPPEPPASAPAVAPVATTAPVPRHEEKPPVVPSGAESRATPAVAAPASEAAVAPTTPASVSAHDSAQDVALYVIAFSLLTIAGALVWFVVRRGRSPGSASLITQSMDRPR